MRQETTGFTLLELLVVLAILALVSAMAVSRTGGAYQRAQLQTTITHVARLDEQARSLAASRREPLVLRVNLTKGELRYEAGREPMGQPLVLPSAVQVERFLSARERKSSGEATVRIGRVGAGESYALKLSAGGTSPEWILLVGGSGQLVRHKTATEVEEYFRVLKQNGPHAA